MADLNTGDGGGGKRHGGKVRAKKSSTRIDMTPMVDLAFLLLTFFMLTTTFSKPQAMEITMPVKDDPTKNTEVPKERAVNILLTKDDQIYYYFGMATGNELPQLIKSDYSKDGIRKVLIERNKAAFNRISELKAKAQAGEIEQKEYRKQVSEIKKEDKQGPIVLIKADEDARYKNIVDILDEMAITGVGRYAVVDPLPSEIEALKNPPAQ